MWMSSVLDTGIFPMTNDHCLAIAHAVYTSTRSHVQETAAPASSTSVACSAGTTISSMHCLAFKVGRASPSNPRDFPHE